MFKTINTTSNPIIPVVSTRRIYSNTQCGSYSMSKYIPSITDNFSFHNNGIKKCTCWKTVGFFGKQWGFFKAMFLTRLHT